MMQAIRLKTEHLQNPVGVDFTTPRLFWNCEGGKRQTAYQIIAESDSEAALWDSGKVDSSSMCALWGGNPVPRKTKVFWKVRLWDETNTAGQWSQAFFETGMDTWSAKWITGNYRVNKKQRYPVDCFQKTFHVSEWKKARLYITACGLYEAELNGQRIGDFILAPGITDYRKRVQYQTYDVTDSLTAGQHQLTVQLADGSLPLLVPMSEIAGRMAKAADRYFRMDRTRGGKRPSRKRHSPETAHRSPHPDTEQRIALGRHAAGQSWNGTVPTCRYLRRLFRFAPKGQRRTERRNATERNA